MKKIIYSVMFLLLLLSVSAKQINLEQGWNSIGVSTGYTASLVLEEIKTGRAIKLRAVEIAGDDVDIIRPAGQGRTVAARPLDIGVPGGHIPAAGSILDDP